jgi:hypothetical protein
VIRYVDPQRADKRRVANAAHSQLLRDVRDELADVPGIVLWVNPRGVATFADKTGAVRRRVDYGLAKGASDLVGILRIEPLPFPIDRAHDIPIGRFIALEIKTGNAQRTKHQRMFQEIVRRMGGFACVIRDRSEARAAIARARKGDSE